ncbi:MAG: DUF6263 family protein [Ferruginibacter sp.]
MKKIISAFLMLAGFCPQAQTYKPAVKLQAGKKYTIVTTAKGNMSQELMGQSMDIPVEMNATSLLEVKNVKDKSYDLSSTTSHLVLSMTMMGQSMNYDSDKKEDQEGQLGQMMGGGINKPASFSINSFGKIIAGSIKKSESPEKEAPGGGMMMGMMKMSGEDEISPAINLFASDAEMKLGDSFTDSSSSANGKDKRSTTYTLSEITDGAIKFTINGISAVTSETEMQGMQTVSNTSTKSTGEMWISTATGLLVKKVLNMTITGTIEVAGMSIPMNGTNVVTITVEGQ